MPQTIEHLFANNKAWSERMHAEDPEFFARLVNQQSPEYLWIGCSDSRVPANQIVGLAPGEIFVHRNIANVVVHTDLNALSVIHYAVEMLRVKHILVVGHYGCGGVKAALHDNKTGLTDNWLRHVQDVRDRHLDKLNQIDDEKERLDRMCELNAIHQVVNISQTSVLREAWARGQNVTVHGWCYSLNDGLVRELGVSASSREDAVEQYRSAADRLL
ncbi:carbonate dehydratase [Azoarcus communis]|uniref:Carbonic anhydrase 2 n=1 Tax=Parazoarcus communis SWub3 = DSM 12120 TaxID=1121029 RepID=A0A323V2U0_9RHOO|nr:carbonate dehydratase [Parazoarcus communis]NMG50402.1 carbonate dehydratase [Parazoarcus communis]NMG72435.1 carbonate dehydratase [Parazoarcus communis SWub3 = DSM 12120]PZA14458.1 carbonate dehydratase [Azoarcus communis] [Parazoarcus communis SWub3 = DSM 12120]